MKRAEAFPSRRANVSKQKCIIEVNDVIILSGSKKKKHKRATIYLEVVSKRYNVFINRLLNTDARSNYES